MSTAALMARLMPLPEVAEALGVSVYTIRRLVESNSISAVRIGARVMVKSSIVEQIQQQGVGTPRKRTRAKR